MTLTDILNWLTGADAGAFLLVSWAIAWGLEGTAWWQSLKSQLKVLIIVGVSGALGASAVALQASPQIVAALEPYLQPLIYAVLAWLGTQTAHKINKRVEKNAGRNG